MSKKKNLYTGKGGQFFVMSEFLMRGWNVAVPEVDIGDDVFVVRDSNGDFSRIQVKTAIAKERAKGFSVQFNIPLLQLETPVTPELTYVFAIRYNQKWHGLLIISREDLYDKEYKKYNVGSLFENRLQLYITYQGDQIFSKGRDWSLYSNNLTAWEIIEH